MTVAPVLVGGGEGDEERVVKREDVCGLFPSLNLALEPGVTVPSLSVLEV